MTSQYYGNPFAATGKYSDFKMVANSRAGNYYNRFSEVKSVLNGNPYEVSENNITSANYNFTNPNFDFSQFRPTLFSAGSIAQAPRLFLFARRIGLHLFNRVNRF